MVVFVIPAYNEEANVPRLLADLERRPDLWADGGYVILVDDGFIRERGFACKAEILMKLSNLGITIAEVPVTLDWSKREGESKMKVLPTMGGYARVMARQAVARARS